MAGLVVGVVGVVVSLVFTVSNGFMIMPSGPPPTAKATPSGRPIETPIPSVEPSPSASPTAASPGSVSPTPPPPTSTPSIDDQLDTFVRDCEQATTFRTGQVSFPAEKRLRVGQSASYGAAVDVRTSPSPAATVIDEPNPRSEPIKVRCVLSARLVAVGVGLDVQPDTDADDRGWRTFQFTPNGVVEWSWTVTLTEPADKQLRLELMPAVVVEATGQSSVVNSSASYLTPVVAETTTLERASYWFGTQWKLLAGIAGVLGAALLAVLAFSSQVKSAAQKLARRNSSLKDNPDTDPDDVEK